MIRDNGTTVSFLINSHNESTYVESLPWGYTLNGVTNNNRETRYSAGAGWVTLGTWTVSSDQTVTFRLFDTGTSGLGGPTTLSVDIDRASVPSKAAAPSISNITADSMRVKWTPGSANGSAIIEYQVARNTANALSNATVFPNRDTDETFTGLAQGVTYYWWVRTRNAKGYSLWSNPTAATTIKAGAAPYQPIVSDASQTGFTASFTDGNNNGSAVVQRQLAYNTVNDPATATHVNYSGVMVVTALQPATTYYVWGRVRNAAGWGPYSPVATIRTIAGAWVNVNGVWREAIPYVKSVGVWKLARPWCREAGVWKESR